MGLLRRAASKAKRVILGAVRRPQEPAPAEVPAEVEPAPVAPPVDVLFVNGTDLPTLRRYRVLHQREQLELRGLSTDEVHYTAACASDADRANALLVYRCPHTPGVEELITRAHEQGKRVWFDVDDLVTSTSYTDDLPFVRSMAPEEKAVFDDGVTRTGQTLALCDGVIVSTGQLAQELGASCPRTLINRNVASQEMVRLSEEARLARQPREDGGVVLGFFSGSLTHNADFLLILPTLVEVMALRPQVLLEVVGDVELPEGLAAFEDRVIRLPYVDWTELPAHIASADVNLAPLEDTVFNRAKSENRWLEAALVGVPTVASDVGSLSHAIRSGETGLLCTTVEEWKDALLRLVDDPSLRETVGERARLWCLAHATTATTGGLLAQLLAPSSPTVERLSPQDPELRRDYVDAFLATRGLERPELAYAPRPWDDHALGRRLSDAEDVLAQGRRLALFVYERLCGDDATFRYFGYNTVQRLVASPSWGGIWLFVDELADDRVRDLVARSSGIVLVRCRARPELVELARLAREAGTPLAYCLDDNALGAKTAPRIIRDMATDKASEFERDFWTGVTERFRLASELTSCFFAPLPNFAQMLADETRKPAFVVHSSLNDEQVAVARRICETRAGDRADGRVIIGYFSGTASHQTDFALARDALVRLLERHEDACLLLGGHLTLDEGLLGLVEEGRLITMPPVDYVTLQYLQASCDAVIAPLVVDDFTNCKSALKVFEAGIVGTPACASASYAYREAIDDGVTGFVCADETDWDRQLEALYQAIVVDPSALSSAARRRAEGRYHGQAILVELESALDGMVGLAVSPDIDAVAEVVAEKDVDDWDNPFVTNPLFAR